MEFDISEIWDRITEEWDYFIHLEWLGDGWEFITGIFSNLGEFSIVGTIYGLVMVIAVYIFRGSVFAFINQMSAAAQIFWKPVFYIVAFIMGYLMGKRVWER